MLEALERVAATSEQPIAATGAAAPITPPATGQPLAGASPEPGPIPFRDHKTILENTRTKAFQERDAQWRQQFGWASTIKADEGPKVVEFYRELDADPLAFYQKLGRALADHPQFGPRFAQVSGNGQRPQANLSEPDLVVDDGNGRQIATYSADRVKNIVADEVRKAVMEVRGELAPLRDAHQRSLVDQQTREYRQSLETHADTIMTRVDKIVGVTKDAQGKLDARSLQLYQQIDTLMDANPTLDVLDAALQVRERVVAPQQTEQAKAQAAEEMRRKAAGNTANGAGTGSAPISRPRTQKELAQWMRDREGASA